MGDYGNEFVVEHPMGEATQRALRDAELNQAVQATELIDPTVMIDDLTDGLDAARLAAPASESRTPSAE